MTRAFIIAPLIVLAIWAEQSDAQMNGPLRVHPGNPRYFTDESGNAIYLTGSHEWLNAVDGGPAEPVAKRDYTAMLRFLKTYNHNFQRFWVWEQAKWVCEKSTPFYFTPSIYRRTGPGLALDGKPKFNLDSLDVSYFQRIRQRISEAADSGIYCAVMLFNGWSIEERAFNLANPWDGHPFNGKNNVNGIDADLNRDGEGREFHTYQPMIWKYQARYIKAVIDAVNDLDNVLYEVSNESPPESISWQQMIMDSIRAYESLRPMQHLVGITGDWKIENALLYETTADWVSPGEDPLVPWRSDPPDMFGSKVFIVDTDHLWGIGGTRDWVWKTFLRGSHPIYMDQYDGSYGWDPYFDSSNANVVNTRLNMGWTLAYARRLNLAALVPRTDLSSTGYCLGSVGEVSAQVIVYQPQAGGSVTLDLRGTGLRLGVEWFDPAACVRVPADSVEGGVVRTFTPPFASDAVLILSGGTALPGAVETVEPTDGSVFRSDSVRFRWKNGRPAGTRYWLEIAEDSRFLASDIDSMLTDTTAVKRSLKQGRYWWKVRARNASGWGPFGKVKAFDVEFPTDVAPKTGRPTQVELMRNYPNPFNPRTTIPFFIPAAGPVRLSIFDILGRRVRVLLDEMMPAGHHTASWDGLLESGSQAGSGFYIARLEANGTVRTMKITRLR